jgi:DNA-binding MarR family transcriptional regulator
MNTISASDRDAARRRRRLTNEIKDSLRDLRGQLALLNHQVGGHLELRDVDLDCLDLISRHGPLSPGALARRAGLHPATMTGILDRLERGGWISRDRLELLADFLRRTTDAGRDATDELADD